jgi:hypothetical protein
MTKNLKYFIDERYFSDDDTHDWDTEKYPPVGMHNIDSTKNVLSRSANAIFGDSPDFSASGLSTASFLFREFSGNCVFLLMFII